jgi:hypothetical protein
MCTLGESTSFTGCDGLVEIHCYFHVWMIFTYWEVVATYLEERSTLEDGYEDLYAIFYGNEGSGRLLGVSNENPWRKRWNLEFSK